LTRNKKGKGFPHSTPSVGPGADPGVQAVSLQVTVSHPPGGRLPLLSARPAVTSSAAELQGSHKPGIIREFCKPGKVRELEIWSGNFYDMSHGLRLAY